MSILAPTPIDETTRAQRKARQLKHGARQMTEMMANQWIQLFTTLWSDPEPQAILDELGTDASEFFALNTALVTFMLTHLQGKRDDLVAGIMGKAASLPACTIHEDGTVTIDPVGEP